MDHEAQINYWIMNDTVRMEALSIAAELNLPDWCLAAGFVRNLVWDKLHGFTTSTTLNDIDLIYFDPNDKRDVRDREIECRLQSESRLPWSVKNQARMHERNGDRAYASTVDAMRFWVEIETAVGATMKDNGDVVVMAPFGIEPLFAYTITLNPTRPKRADFEARLINKQWLTTWPKLVVNG